MRGCSKVIPNKSSMPAVRHEICAKDTNSLVNLIECICAVYIPEACCSSNHIPRWLTFPADLAITSEFYEWQVCGAPTCCATWQAVHGISRPASSYYDKLSGTLGSNTDQKFAQVQAI